MNTQKIIVQREYEILELYSQKHLFLGLEQVPRALGTAPKTIGTGTKSKGSSSQVIFEK